MENEEENIEKVKKLLGKYVKITGRDKANRFSVVFIDDLLIRKNKGQSAIFYFMVDKNNGERKSKDFITINKVNWDLKFSPFKSEGNMKAFLTAEKL